MGILAELLAEVEEVKTLRARVDTEKKVAEINLEHGARWYRKYYATRQMARIWKKAAKRQLQWRKGTKDYNAILEKKNEALTEALTNARLDRSYAENRNATRGTELEEAHKLIDILRKQCQDDYEDIRELREQRNAAERAAEIGYNKNQALLLEVSRLYTENYELREKIRCSE